MPVVIPEEQAAAIRGLLSARVEEHPDLGPMCDVLLGDLVVGRTVGSITTDEALDHAAETLYRAGYRRGDPPDKVRRIVCPVLTEGLEAAAFSIMKAVLEMCSESEFRHRSADVREFCDEILSAGAAKVASYELDDTPVDRLSPRAVCSEAFSRLISSVRRVTANRHFVRRWLGSATGTSPRWLAGGPRQTATRDMLSCRACCLTPRRDSARGSG